MQINNMWSIIGGAAAIVAVFVLTALLNFFSTGAAWPATTQGWLTIVVPALCAGLLAVLTPHYSMAEAKTGARHIDSTQGDALVIDKGSPSQVPAPVALPPSPPVASSGITSQV